VFRANDTGDDASGGRAGFASWIVTARRIVIEFPL
jgi:hypothetical protein